MKKQPIRLSQDPIIEALAELQFQPIEKAAGELIPGMMFPQIRKFFPKIERLPFAEIPLAFQEMAPNLTYQASQRLTGENVALLLGSHVATIARTRPYVGWGKFRELIFTVLDSLKSTEMVKQVERFSIKYVNILEAKDRESQYALLNLKASMAQYDLTKHLSTFRTEIVADGVINIVEITPEISAVAPDGKPIRGLLLSNDSIFKTDNKFWTDQQKIVDKVHDSVKAIFYDLLTDEAVGAFKPIWK
jgi:uncharacterized protein (TIGR04255 family)